MSDLQNWEFIDSPEPSDADFLQGVQRRTIYIRQIYRYRAELKRISDRLHASLDEQQILQTAVTEIGKTLGVDQCFVSLVDEAKGSATVQYEYNPAPRPSLLHLTLPIDEILALHQATRFRRWVQCCPIVSSVAYPPSTMLICSMMKDRKAFGDFWLFRPTYGHFRNAEIRLVRDIANQCAIALYQSRLYQTAQQKVKALERQHQQKDDFLNTVSHEVRSPLANMKMAVQLLKLALEPLLEGEQPTSDWLTPKKITKYIEILELECDRELSLVNDLLDLQRLDVGAQVLDRQPIDLSTWLQEVTHSFEQRAVERCQSLTHQLPAHLPVIRSDRATLNRILSELLHNACKYTPPGERIVLSSDVKPDCVVIQVTNFGVEIPAAAVPYIFNKFYRVPQGDRWQQGGTGLGLALVKKLVEHLGGAVGVCSEGNKTTFTVEIPH